MKKQLFQNSKQKVAGLLAAGFALTGMALQGQVSFDGQDFYLFMSDATQARVPQPAGTELVLEVVTDPAGLPAGQYLKVDKEDTANFPDLEKFATPLSSKVTLAEGESLTASVAFQFDGVPGSIFRFGLFDSKEAPVTGDDYLDHSWDGYYTFVRVGGGDNATRRDGDPDEVNGRLSAGVNIGSADGGPLFFFPYELTFKITNLGASGVEVYTQVINLNDSSVVFESTQVEAAGGNVLSFDAFEWRQGPVNPMYISAIDFSYNGGGGPNVPDVVTFGGHDFYIFTPDPTQARTPGNPEDVLVLGTAVNPAGLPAGEYLKVDKADSTGNVEMEKFATSIGQEVTLAEGEMLMATVDFQFEGVPGGIFRFGFYDVAGAPVTANGYDDRGWDGYYTFVRMAGGSNATRRDGAEEPDGRLAGGSTIGAADGGPVLIFPYELSFSVANLGGDGVQIHTKIVNANDDSVVFESTQVEATGDNVLTFGAFEWRQGPVNPMYISAIEFAKADIGGMAWYGYPIGAQQWVDTGSWMGWVNVTFDPWVWNEALAKYTYVNDDSGWVYIPK